MHILGIVTFDDLFDVAEEEATEDIHQFGGHQALDTAYLHTPIFSMFKKARWLADFSFPQRLHLWGSTAQLRFRTKNDGPFLRFFFPLSFLQVVTRELRQHR